MYKIVKSSFQNISANMVENLDINMFIPYDGANRHYVLFKNEINSDQAQLQDADGTLMSADDAKAFVATLP